ncbi:MAG: macro domain-containing protein [Candidatus Altiarchaeales archaeon]|nr:MAG: macro domain-containing protein [Candidatus Altiarchaeales archaeon]
MSKIKVIKGDITSMEVDAIVNPANSLMLMGGGVALAIKLKGGEIIEKEAMEKAPVPVGEAIFTKAGKLKAKYVIHSPTMEKPAQKISLKEVEKATIAALKVANSLKLKSLAFPGMGTGVGGVDKDEAAKVMVDCIKNYKGSLEEVILVAYDSQLYEAFQRALEEE